MLDPDAPPGSFNPPSGIAVTVTVAAASDCTETVAGETASVIPCPCVTCNVTFCVAVSPSPTAVTVNVAEPTAAVDAAASVSISEFELTLAEGVMGFADHPAVTPLGNPLTLQPMFPLNDPPVAVVRLTVPDAPCTATTELEAAVTVSVGSAVTVSTYATVCVPELSEPVTVMLCARGVAVDPTASVTVAVIPGVIDAGLMLAVTPAGALAVSATAFLAEPPSVTPIVNVRVLPTSTAPDAADCVRAKSVLATPLDPAPQLLTSTAPSTDPRPVARLYAPPLAVKPVTPGTLLFPEGVG